MTHTHNRAHELIEEAKEEGQKHLDLSYLNLSHLPEEIGLLTDLIELDLSNNFLSQLPQSFQHLTKLLKLNLSENNFSDFSFNAPHRFSLTEVNLNGNSLNQIPDCLLNLPFLETLLIGGNPISQQIPPEILDSDFESMIDYIEGVRNLRETTRVFEAKLLLVGNGEVGKTSILKKITDPGYKIRLGLEKTTHGIRIEPWKVKIAFPSREPYYNHYEDLAHLYQTDQEYEELVDGLEIGQIDIPVTINVWDFGGQDIYHSTHQFFLTERSLYMVIWEPRKNDNIQSLDYWLNIVQKLSNSSPVIVVMNKSDIRVENIDENQVLNNYPNIVAFHKVSCIDSHGIVELRKEIFQNVRTLPHIGDKLPLAWLAVREELSLKREKNFISLEDYFEICRFHGLTTKRAIFLSEYLHDLGVILHFKQDTFLENFVVLNPEWVTSAVYSLIDSRTVQKNNGLFNFTSLRKAWNLKDYPKTKHYELVRLMEKFELCFNVIGTEDYIIPDLLDEGRKFSIKSNKIDLRFQFEYTFLPSGVFTRLICRLYNLIMADSYSKSSVALNYEDTECLLSLELTKKILDVKISGLNGSEFLAIIRKNVRHINDTLNLEEGKDVFEKLACNCHDCQRSSSPHFFKYDTIKKFRQKGKNTIDCLNSAEAIEIKELIHGYPRKSENQNLLNSLIFAASQLQGIAQKLEKDEDTRNTYIATLLSSRNHIAKDQSRWGKSQQRKKMGELDIKIEDRKGLPLSVFEGFILKNLNRTTIKNHLLKIFGYDPVGLKRNFAVIYSEATQFDSLWKKYKEFVSTISFPYKAKSEVLDISEEFSFGSGLRIAKTIHEREGIDSELYHIFIDLSK